MNTPMTATHVFYSESINSIIDTCTDQDPPRAHISRETLEEIRARYSDAVYMPFVDAIILKDNKNKKPVQEITRAEFWEMLEVLPPEGWTQDESGHAESFKMSERWSGTITGIYARIEERYFCLQDHCFMKHAAIVEQCEAYLKKHPITSLTCCCCGSDTRGQQWHNRDTGYGLCGNCAAWIKTKETPEQMKANYGEEGIHYFTNTTEEEG